ncbi:MAG: VOC family protein [Formivibrio sp.]|nr:VOC family protein [Formivibrio sp.]
MRIEHVALWTEDIGRCVDFYQTYFDAVAGDRYTNPAKGFESCFLSFGSGARLEVMKTTSLSLQQQVVGTQRMGLTHLAFSVGSKTQVDALTQRLQQDGYAVLDGPRQTGDGYHESVVLDPDGNRIEVTV